MSTGHNKTDKDGEDNMNTKVADELWTISDIAAYLKMSPSTIYKNWKKFGIAPVVAYPGAKPRFPKAEVMKIIARQK